MRTLALAHVNKLRYAKLKAKCNVYRLSYSSVHWTSADIGNKTLSEYGAVSDASCDRVSVCCNVFIVALTVDGERSSVDSLSSVTIRTFIWIDKIVIDETLWRWPLRASPFVSCRILMELGFMRKPDYVKLETHFFKVLCKRKIGFKLSRVLFANLNKYVPNSSLLSACDFLDLQNLGM